MLSSDDFNKRLQPYLKEGKRDLPWRRTEPNGQFEAYKILVSEVMLQQTQVRRVIIKYQQFLDKFPDVASLAAAPFAQVLQIWSGLGYNRRAKYLHEAAKQLVSIDGPWSFEDLLACKGVGANTAAAICVYAYNQPRLFVETNIRTVYIHHFFEGYEQIADREILSRLAETLDKQRPRDFYWALMDYGTFLKKTTGNTARRSRLYVKQTKFDGSVRQLRGYVLRLLLERPQDEQSLVKLTADERLGIVLEQLQAEGLIITHGGRFRIP